MCVHEFIFSVSCQLECLQDNSNEEPKEDRRDYENVREKEGAGGRSVSTADRFI
jgi:hypothetical protein